MRKNIRFFKKLKFNNDGSTMVETLVSFVILSIILLVLLKMISISNEMRLSAIGIGRINQEFLVEVYKTTGFNTDIIEKTEYPQTDDGGFVLVFDDEKTDEKNLGINSGYYSSIKSANVKMKELKATGYKSVNDMIDEEKMITPKLLIYKYSEIE